MLTLLLFIAAADTVRPLPPDVVAFVERRQACDHFRGEEPYDAERRAFLDGQVRALCQEMDAELARLRAVYKSRADVVEQLQMFEEGIEPCAISGAAIQWQADYCLLESETDDLMAAQPCLEREQQRRYTDACAQVHHYKRAMCVRVIEHGWRAGKVDACMADPEFEGLVVSGNGSR